jgi:hypothetical protein
MIASEGVSVTRSPAAGMDRRAAASVGAAGGEDAARVAGSPAVIVGVAEGGDMTETGSGR